MCFSCNRNHRLSVNLTGLLWGHPSRQWEIPTDECMFVLCTVCVILKVLPSCAMFLIYTSCLCFFSWPHLCFIYYFVQVDLSQSLFLTSEPSVLVRLLLFCLCLCLSCLDLFCFCSWILALLAFLLCFLYRASLMKLAFYSFLFFLLGVCILALFSKPSHSLPFYSLPNMKVC